MELFNEAQGIDKLVSDIVDFIHDFKRLPTTEEVKDWAEDIYGIYLLETNRLTEIIRQGAEKAK